MAWAEMKKSIYSLAPLREVLLAANRRYLEFISAISGFQNKDLRRRVEGKNTGQVSRLMKWLRTHGLIKKIGRTYKYYLTTLGKQVITSASSSKTSMSFPSFQRYQPAESLVRFGKDLMT